MEFRGWFDWQWRETVASLLFGGHIRRHPHCHGQGQTGQEQFATIKVTVVSIKPQSVNDGENAQFTVLGASDATAYSWGWSAPKGAKNDPKVTFSNPNSSITSVPRAKWFALANDPSLPVKACGTNNEEASRSCKYTITCDITFPNTSVTATSFLTVNVPWQQGGGVEITIRATGHPAYDRKFNRRTGLWEVTGLGTITRQITPLSAAVNVPASSHFYDKLAVHEQVHIDQYETGIASTYFLLNSGKHQLWTNHLQGLSNANPGLLDHAVSNAIYQFIKAEQKRIERDGILICFNNLEVRGEQGCQFAMILVKVFEEIDNGLIELIKR